MYNKHVLHMLDLSKSLWVHHFKAQLHIKRERHSCWHSASNRVQGTGLLQGVKLSLVNVIHLQGTISFIYRYHLAVNRLNKTMDSRLGHRVSKKKKKTVLVLLFALWSCSFTPAEVVCLLADRLQDANRLLCWCHHRCLSVSSSCKLLLVPVHLLCSLLVFCMFLVGSMFLNQFVGG